VKTGFGGFPDPPPPTPPANAPEEGHCASVDGTGDAGGSCGGAQPRNSASGGVCDWCGAGDAGTDATVVRECVCAYDVDITAMPTGGIGTGGAPKKRDAPGTY